MRKNPFTFFLQVVFDECGHVLLQFGTVQNLDMIGKTNVEPADAFHLIDFGVEVPNVVVTFVGLDAVLGRRELLDKEVLGHQVELERDTAGKTEQYASVPQRNKRSPIFHIASIYRVLKSNLKRL